MGGSNEFYDKFSVRYHVSVIIRKLWYQPVHKKFIIDESMLVINVTIRMYNEYLCTFTHCLFILYVCAFVINIQDMYVIIIFHSYLLQNNSMPHLYVCSCMHSCLITK